MNRFGIGIVCCVCAGQPLMAAGDNNPMEQMVVTAVRTDAPLHIVTDPKAPRQPLPASDGADYLKTIPGFAVIRKGGTDGDPLLRGMAGSRLSLLQDGAVVLGGCSNRMDPPTAYIFPETFDRIEVIKGPQSVQHGPGNAAGVVLFEKDHKTLGAPGWDAHVSALLASAGRHDEVVDATWTSAQFAVRGAATRVTADDYANGDNVVVHSQYRRWNSQLDLAWMPSADTRLELGLARGDGQAAYADRGVDGARFDRDNLSLRFIRGPLEMYAYYNYVDHVMDNYTLRTPAGMTGMPVAMNPDRRTTGGKITWSFEGSDIVDSIVGLDWQQNQHAARNTMNQNLVPYESLARVNDAKFAQFGVFGELGWNASDTIRLAGGLRLDDWQVTDQRDVVALGMMGALPDPTAHETRDSRLHSGFIRLEKQLGEPDGQNATVYAGVGRNARHPDYWEMIVKETELSLSALDINPEITRQFDTGVVFRTGDLSGSVSAFVNQIDDFLMIQSGFAKGMRTTTIVRNVDVRSWGLEVDSQYRFDDHWRLEASLASVRGTNETDDATLPQLPPLEVRWGAYYNDSVWSAGFIYRGIAGQDRVDIGKGNIVGQDIGVTASANIFSFNAGWRPSSDWLLTAGIDNLLDTTYAEHVSRSGAAIAGFTQTARIDEPGRTMWLKLQLTID